MAEQNKTTLREADNKAVIEGVLLEIRHQEWKSGKGLSIELDIETAENEVHTVNGMSKYEKADGTVNKISTGYQTMIDEYKSVADVGREDADKVRIDQAQLGKNEYFGQDDKLRSFPQLSAKFANRVQASEEFTPRAEFEVEVFIHSVVDEFKGEDETGRAIVKALIPLYGGKVIPFEFIVSDEDAVEYVKDSYEAGVTVNVYGDIVNFKEKKVTSEKGAFGKAKENVTYKTVREYVITGGSEPYDEDNAKAYKRENIKKALTEREVYLEEMKSKKNDSQSKPKKEEKKGFDTKKEKSSKKIEISDDDLPF